MSKSRAVWILLLLLLFAALAAGVQMGLTTGVEADIYTAVIRPMSPALTAFLKLVTHSCDPLSVVVICLLLLLVPVSRRTVAMPVWAAVAGSAVLNRVLKHLFGRERPGILPLLVETSPSFPSGHAMNSAALYWTLLLLLPCLLESKRAQVAGAVVCACMPLLIGFSRVYLGVHHAGDVVGGWLLGAAIALATDGAWRWMGRVKRRGVTGS